jgi:hypothetical protein
VNTAVTSNADERPGCQSVTPDYTLSVRLSDPVTSAVSVPVQENIPAGLTGSASTTYLFDVDLTSPGPRTFNVDASMSFDGCYLVHIDLNAVWVPFGSTGSSTP